MRFDNCIDQYYFSKYQNSPRVWKLDLKLPFGFGALPLAETDWAKVDSTLTAIMINFSIICNSSCDDAARWTKIIGMNSQNVILSVNTPENGREYTQLTYSEISRLWGKNASVNFKTINNKYNILLYTKLHRSHSQRERERGKD